MLKYICASGYRFVFQKECCVMKYAREETQGRTYSGLWLQTDEAWWSHCLLCCHSGIRLIPFMRGDGCEPQFSSTQTNSEQAVLPPERFEGKSVARKDFHLYGWNNTNPVHTGCGSKDLFRTSLPNRPGQSYCLKKTVSDCSCMLFL